MIGYKAFNDNLTCRNFQYEVGKTYEMNREPECCCNGFHFCRDLTECFNYYDFGSRVCIVEALGDIDTRDEEKFCTNKIKIIRELSFEEVCNIIGIEVNLANILLKSFKLTKDFFREKNALLGEMLYAAFFFWDVQTGFYSWQFLSARLSTDSKRIIFYRLDNYDKVLFEYSDEEIYQVEKLEGENLELFKYLRDNL